MAKVHHAALLASCCLIALVIENTCVTWRADFHESCSYVSNSAVVEYITLWYGIHDGVGTLLKLTVQNLVAGQ